jgi:hypothetical protein
MPIDSSNVRLRTPDRITNGHRKATFYHDAAALKLTYLSETNSLVICTLRVGDGTSPAIEDCSRVKRSMPYVCAA